MATTIQRKQDELQEAAAEYRNLMLQIKELEKKAVPVKKALTDYAKGINLMTLDLGAVTLERRSSLKSSLNRSAVTPDWLWRMQRDGFFGAVGISIDSRKLPPEDAAASSYLAEVGYEEKESFTYAIRLNHDSAKP